MPLNKMMNTFQWLCLPALMAGLFAPVTSAWAESSATKTPAAEGAGDLFDNPKVLVLNIEIPAAALARLKADHKTYVKATLREESKALENVGIRYKGNLSLPGSARKPSFTLKFNEFNSEHRFHGQRKLTLDSSANDPTYLGEVLANDLFRAARVPAARCTFARVELNGADLGLYVATEGVNRDFLGRHFDKTKGNLYEGDSNDVTDTLNKDSGEETKDQPDLAALVGAARVQNPEQRWQRLEKVLDLPRFLSFAAVEVFTWNTDGYCLSPKKYRIYHDPASDKLVFLPHRQEQLFAKPEGAVLPEMGGLVARAVLETAEGRRQYKEALGKLLASVVQGKALYQRITDLSQRIRPVLAQSDPSSLKAFDEAVAQLRVRLAQRIRVVEQKLKS